MTATFTTVDGARVGVLLGSATDWQTMTRCSQTLSQLGVAHECNVISAHRNHDRLAAYIKSAEHRGLSVFICAAGGAAHLAGVVASMTAKPVLGCPMKAWALEGLDSLLSTAQMPKGVPVATFAIGAPGAVNAALFAASMLALSDDDVRSRLLEFRRKQSEEVSSLGES